MKCCSLSPQKAKIKLCLAQRGSASQERKKRKTETKQKTKQSKTKQKTRNQPPALPDLVFSLGASQKTLNTTCQYLKITLACLNRTQTIVDLGPLILAGRFFPQTCLQRRSETYLIEWCYIFLFYFFLKQDLNVQLKVPGKVVNTAYAVRIFYAWSSFYAACNQMTNELSSFKFTVPALIVWKETRETSEKNNVDKILHLKFCSRPTSGSQWKGKMSSLWMNQTEH